MASADENAAAIRQGYEAFNSGTLQGLPALFAEDVVWHVGGRHQLSGEKRGREACFQYFGQLSRLTNGSFRAELHDVLGGTAHTIGIHTSRGERAGRELAEPTVLVFHLRDGTIAACWEHYADSRRVDEFFGD
jgi:ketosteroid isomerase-like protein